MKYINADLLKSKLDEHYRNYQSKYMKTRTPHAQGLIDALDLAEQVIDSLQQEQPVEGLEEEVKKYWNAHALDYRIGRVADLDFMLLCARHFYELGMLNARKEE